MTTLRVLGAGVALGALAAFGAKAGSGQAVGAQPAADQPVAALVPSGGAGTIYWAGYDHAIHVIDESTLDVVDKIPVATGIPIGLTLSSDRERLYVRDAEFEEIEMVDLATRKSTGSFTLSRGRSKVRIWGFTVDPDEDFAVLTTIRYTKRIDRWEIDDPVMLKYDLRQGEVADTIPWPSGEERERARLMFSPGGEYLYFFGRDVLVLETENFTEADRWELSRPIEDGLGRFSFGFPTSLHDEPGFHTGLFSFTDPVQNRSIMGIARVDLAQKQFDFFTLGPRRRVSFELAPGGKKAYGLVQEIGNYEFWTFDLEGRRVESRHRFPGRPRMALEVSSNGKLLYVYNAGATIDVYDAASHELLRTVAYDADMTDWVMIPEGMGPTASQGANPAAR